MRCVLSAVLFAALWACAAAQLLLQSGHVRVLEGLWVQADVEPVAVPNFTRSVQFGADVDVDGSILVVGAPAASEAGSNIACGAVFVYQDGGGDPARLDPPACTAAIGMGASVAVWGNLVAAGATKDASRGPNTGAVFTYARMAGGTWAYGAKVVAHDGASSDYFGMAVALQSGILVVGAPGDRLRAGSAYMYFADSTTPTGAPWTYVRKLQPQMSSGDFTASAVALQVTGRTSGILALGARSAVSNQGAVVVYTSTTPFEGLSWKVSTILRPPATGVLQFGRAVAISGATLIAGAPNANTVGAAYVYTNTNKTHPATSSLWNLKTTLAPTPVLNVDDTKYFGHDVAATTDTVAVTSYSDSAPAGAFVSLYKLNALIDNYVHTTRLHVASGLESSTRTMLGAIAFRDADQLVAGAPYGTPGGNAGEIGTAVVVDRSQDIHRRAIITSDTLGVPNNQFGAATAVSPVIHAASPNGVAQVLAAVGVPRDTVASNTACGSAQVLVYNVIGAVSDNATALPSSMPPPPSVAARLRPAPDALSWTTPNVSRQVKFMPSTCAPFDYYGSAVAVYGSMVLVGAPGTNFLATDAGAAWLHVPATPGVSLTSMSWDERRVRAATPVTNAKYGTAVALSSDLVAVVGAPGDQYSTLAPINCGAVHVFNASRLDTFTTARILPPSAISALNFGTSVAIHGNTIVVGATGLTVDGVTNHGAAYVYTFDVASAAAQGFSATTVFALQAQLMPSTSSRLVGSAVALNDRAIAVGARSDSTAAPFTGAVFVFTRDPARAFAQLSKLTPPRATGGEAFGSTLSMHAAVLVAGARYHDETLNDAGAVLVAAPTSTWHATSPWTITAQFSGMQGEAAEDDLTGYAVSVGATGLVLAGAPGRSPVKGKAYVISPLGTLPIVATVDGDTALGTAVQRLGCVGQQQYAGFGSCPAFVLDPPSDPAVVRSLHDDHLYAAGAGFQLQRALHIFARPASPLLRLEVSSLDLRDMSWAAYNLHFSQQSTSAPLHPDGALVRAASTSPAVSFTAVSCAFMNAHARRGGALYVSGASATLAGCLVSNCSATLGGAVFVHQDGTLRSISSSFVGNHATELRGGAIATALATVEVQESTFTGNTAQASGGAIHADFGSDTTVSATRFTSNSAIGGSGGGISLDASAATVVGTVFDNCSAADLGGAVHISALATLTLAHVNATRNRAALGGAVGVERGTLRVEPGCWWMENDAVVAGGALSCAGEGIVDVHGVVVSSNHAQEQGGGVRVEGCRANLTSCSFQGNEVLASGATDLQVGGGAVFASVASVTSPAAAEIAPNTIKVLGDTVFVGNSAARGSAVLVTTPSQAAACAANVTACADAPHNYAARFGDSVRVNGTLQWLYQQPALDAATAVASLASMAERVVVVGNGGNEMNVSSGIAVPQFRVELQDVYGHASLPLVAEGIAVEVTPADVASLAGPRAVSFDADGVATVSGLSITAPPGATVTLTLSLSPPRGVLPLFVAMHVAACPAGTHVGVSNTSCVACPSGTYSPQPTTSRDACKQCVAGVAPVGSTACIPCGTGTQPDASGTQCESCGPTAASTGAHCQPCGPGRIPDVLTRSTCLLCDAGTVRPSTSSVCSRCPAGTFSEAARVACVSCGSGAVSTAGASHCVLCKNGTEPNAAKDRCTPCDAVSVSNGAVCNTCPAGMVPDVITQSTCVACSAGTVRPPTSSVCSQCPAGTEADGSHIVCIPCDPGFASAAGAQQCTPCRNGTAPAVGADQCEPCAADAVSTGTVCTTCSPGMVPDVITRSSCVPCSTGTIRPNTSLTCTACEPGFYASAAGTHCIQCPDEGVDCVEGACDVQGNGTVQCAAGRTGPLCAQCVPGTYPEANSCVQCLADPVVWALLLLASLLIVAVAAFSIFTSSQLWRERVSRRAKIMPAVKILLSFLQVMGFLSNMGVPWPATISSLWTSSQSSSSLPLSSGFANCVLHLGFYGLNSAIMALPLLAAVALLLVPATAACKPRARRHHQLVQHATSRSSIPPPPPPVPDSTSAHRRASVQSALFAASSAYRAQSIKGTQAAAPVGTPGSTTRVAGNSAPASKGSEAAATGGKAATSAPTPSGGKAGTSAPPSITPSSTGSEAGTSTPTSTTPDKGSADAQSGWPMYYIAVTVVWYLLYPAVCQAAVKVLDCSPDINGVRYLEADFREECGSSRWRVQVLAVLCVLVLFCLGFPAAICITLFRHHRDGTLHSDNVRRRYLFLFQGYRDECCWWEGVVILRKLAIAVAGAALDGAGNGHQAFAGTFVLVACLVAHLLARPYSNAAEGRLETFSLAASALSLYTGLLLTLGSLTAVAEATTLAVMVVVNTAFVLMAVWELAKRLRRTAQRRGAGLRYLDRFVKRRSRGRRTATSAGQSRSVALVDWTRPGKHSSLRDLKLQANPMRRQQHTRRPT